MRKFFLGTLLLIICTTLRVQAQDFSNKGKEFWLAYSYHVGMVNAGGPPTMTLYITSDVTTTYNVEIFGLTGLASGTINAGQVVTVNIPSTYFINSQGIFNNKAIRVTAARPVVVYSYITRSAASAATLCLPTTVLGREYISMNYKQVSNENNSHSYITIVGVEDNTSVEITPSSTTTDASWVANTTRTINLNKGDIYQVLGAVNGNNGVDLTGSTVKSVASGGGGCKRIAVFSGSGKISIGCSNGGSSDNLYQQLYPVASWGKNYLTIPSFGRPNAIYRIIKSVPGSNVYVNGALIPSTSFVNNVYYEFGNTTPNKIESDQPISVAQFFTTQGCGGNGSPYDPDMIMLNPVEQNIDKVTLVSSSLVATTNRQHHVQVIIRNTGSALSSFRLDGNPVPSASWSAHNADPAYSYIYFSNLTQGYHTLASDSGFNALAYGYADAETYGYSAGSNIKDLYQYVTINNEYATVDFPAACKGSPFTFAMTFPYKPSQIIWQFNGLFPDVTINSPVFNSSSVINGRTIYKYNLPGTFSVPNVGSYPIKIIAQNPTADGCSGEQEIDYELQVFNPPVAEFNFSTNGCVSSPVTFTDNTSNTSGRDIAHWYWSFGDNTNQTGSGNSNTSHTYSGPGEYNVKYTVITDVGCKSIDTAAHIVKLNEPPIAAFNIDAPYCAGKLITFRELSTVAEGSNLVKWIWNFGDNTPVLTATTNADQTHTYPAPGTYNVTLQVETSTGCLSTVFTKAVVISPNPVVDFSLPNICLPVGAAQFTSLTTISDGSQNLFSYLWNFGDAGATSNAAAPIHNYSAAGPFNVSLTVTSNNGCVTTNTKTLTTIYAEPQAAFDSPLEICVGSTINFTDRSSAPGSSITGWQWNFGDFTISTDKNPVKTFILPGIYNVTLSVTSAIGCQSISTANIAQKTIIVHSLPTADFNISLPGCENQAVTFNNASVANSGSLVKWNWNFGDVSNQVRTDGNSFTHTYSGVNVYNVSLQVESDKGCVSTVLTKPVQINAVPVASFTPPDICISDAATSFIENSTVTTGSVNGWEWNFGDSRATSGNPNTANVKQPAHQYIEPGQYTAQLIAVSDAGCRDTVQHAFFVNGAVLTPQFTIENTGALCSNKEIIIKDASQVDAGKIIRVEIFWDENDLSIRTTDNSPTPGKIYNHMYPEFGTPASKVYRIRYDVYSGTVCVSSIVKSVTLLATPVLAFDAGLPVCSNAPSFQLGAQVVNGMPGTGVYSGAGVSPGGMFNPAIGAGSRTIVYTYQGTNGCSNSVAKTVIVDPTPVADAGPDKVVLEGGVVVLTPTLITNIPVSYSWTPATWLNNPAIAKAEASPQTDFTYTLTVTSDKGCTTNDDVFVKLLKSPVIPNIFSPNSDGIHDRWEIEYLESYPGCVVQIYNRYGQMVYQIVNYTTPWDGKINGKDAPVGTYYYIINPKNGRKPMTGFVDIIR